MKLRRRILLALVLGLALAQPGRADDDASEGQDSGLKGEVKKGFKDAAHGVAEGAKKVGHAVKEGAKEGWQATKRGAKKVGHGTKDAGHKVKSEVKGDGTGGEQKDGQKEE
jgi:hypothetical protein